VNAGVRKSVYFLDGKLVFAGSSLTQDRLGEVLLRGGKISADEYLKLSQRIRGGQRLGKALVESGVLSPRDLWWAIEQQVKEIVWSIFNWEDGYFQFEDDELPRREKITFELDGRSSWWRIRRSEGTGAIREHFISTDCVVERTPKASPVDLEHHEKHVIGIADGKRTVSEICQESEIGEMETRKVLHTILAVSVLRSRGPKQAPLAQKLEDREDYRSVVELYNEMYRRLFRHMSGEVGPIARSSWRSTSRSSRNVPARSSTGFGSGRTARSTPVRSRPTSSGSPTTRGAISSSPPSTSSCTRSCSR
jgi:hypothetical protein